MPVDARSFASDLDRLVCESAASGDPHAIEHHLDAIDVTLPPPAPPRAFVMGAAPLERDRFGSEPHAETSPLALVGLAGFLLLMAAAGACGAILIFHDRLSQILR